MRSVLRHRVGDRVRARCSGWANFYPGTITRVLESAGAYDITFDDGDKLVHGQQGTVMGPAAGMAADPVEATVRHGCLPPVRLSRARARRRLAARKEVDRALQSQGSLQATRRQSTSRELRARFRHSAEARRLGSSLTGWVGPAPCFKAVI